MKRNKVLLGLYVGLMTLAGGVVNSQTGGRFYEIGPDNVGGQVSSFVVDRQDTNGTTIYVGATTGGLFLKSASTDYLTAFYGNFLSDEAQIEIMASDTTIWHHVPCNINGSAVSLPINAMVQGPDNTIYIGTGNDDYPFGNTYGKMSVKGMGIYLYNPTTATFQLLPNTENFASVHALDYVYVDGVLYLYAATNSGLYRWRHIDGSNDWNQTPTPVFNGNVDQFVISRVHNTAFFSSGNQLYRIGNVVAAANQLNPINISSSNPAFGGSNSCIKLAVSQTDTTYLYAMVINANGYMDALYLTNNEQTWSTLTTSSIMPITYNSGKTCGAIAVDPGNPRRVIIGGTDVLVGEGFVEGSYYQWTTVSASEFSLNYGDYMSTVYNNSSFIHSGIHQIVPVYHVTPDGDYHTYYFATDGGVYSGQYYNESGFRRFVNENRGLNNLQVNGLAVCPDGSIISGASNNACPIIETHLDHNVADSNYSESNLTWYHDGTLVLNHEANVLWTETGGAVAASAFQQVKPLSRRTIFTSSNGGFFGRSYADYLNYTNTTTWTISSSFMGDQIVNGPAIGSISLWETDNNTIFNDSITCSVDTLGVIYRPKNGKYDTILLAPKGRNYAAYVVYNEDGTRDTVAYPGAVGYAGSFKIMPGDMTYFNSRANADYPIQHVFTHTQLAKEHILLQNPLQARMLVIADQKPSGMGAADPTTTCVWLSWTPTDFTKVYDETEFNSGNFEGQSIWCPIYAINRSLSHTQTHFPRYAVMSRDGRFVYVSVYDTAAHASMLVRISNLENMDFSTALTDKEISDRTMVGVSESPLHVDTILYNNNVWFPRPISNIVVDPRDGQDRLVITFEDFSSDFANVAIIDNPGSNSMNIELVPLSDPTIPAYCALVEDSTGTIYVGTSKGVFTKKGNASWQTYSKLQGVPVTAICQQTRKLPVRHNITHTGITQNDFAFAKTKWPRAIYFGTYGRGIFMDMQYVTDFSNEIVDSADYTPTVDIPTVHTVGLNKINLYPNPVTDEAHLDLNAVAAGNAQLRVYDINGRLVMDRYLGFVAEGAHTFTLNTQGFAKGMYLINLTISGHTATAKMMVR